MANIGLGAIKAHLAAIFTVSATPIADQFVKLQVDLLKLKWFIDWIPQTVWTTEGYLIAGTLGWLAVYWTPNIPPQKGD
jgi:hypothetical protein